MLLRFIVLCFLLPAFLLADLSLSDVHKEMEKIFQKHLSQKSMSGKIMSLALLNYINQFDPYHVYLLASDADPFLHMSGPKLEYLVEQYNNQDYSIFVKLNAVIQASIRKMRRFREEKLTNEASFKEYGKGTMPQANDGFAQTEEELQSRHTLYFATLILAEMGTLKSLNESVSFQAARQVVEFELEERENSYLYRDKQGQPLNPEKKEAVFALHLLEALTTSLDVHSQYLSPQTAQNLAMKLEKQYVGVGLSIVEQGDSYMISGLIKGSSAEISGKIQVGDELISINGTRVATLSPQDMQAMLQGKAGSVVDLVLRREGKGRFNVALMRSEITLQEGRVDTKYEKVVGGIVAAIQLHGFYQGQGPVNSEQDMRNALEGLKKIGPIKGIVLDLRDNQGGFLTQAVKVAGLFMKTGVVVVAKDGQGGLHYFRNENPNPAYTGPLVILTSRETASAAEIVAQTLKDYGLAVIVGDDHTYGKGSLQIENVTEQKHAGPSSAVTIGRYYTVSGGSPQAGGVTADVALPSVLSESKVGEEYVAGSLKNDSIAPSYDDTLSDIPPYKLEWYKMNYLPFLQEKTNKYRKWIPELKSKSGDRMAKNKEYQDLLHSGRESDALRRMQLDEATNITKDLAQLSGA